jgi:hypothetical protein
MQRIQFYARREHLCNCGQGSWFKKHPRRRETARGMLGEGSPRSYSPGSEIDSRANLYRLVPAEGAHGHDVGLAAQVLRPEGWIRLNATAELFVSSCHNHCLFGAISLAPARLQFPSPRRPNQIGTVLGYQPEILVYRFRCKLFHCLVLPHLEPR